MQRQKLHKCLRDIKYDSFYIVGRGTVIPINSDEYKWAKQMNHGDTFSDGDTEYEITGIERGAHTSMIGFVTKKIEKKVEKPIFDAQAKMNYFNEEIRNRLYESFERGDKKYQEMNHRVSDNNVYIERNDEDDINHVRELHVDVRLREAEDFAGEGHASKALTKIESAIGYLVILHYRISKRLGLVK